MLFSPYFSFFFEGDLPGILYFFLKIFHKILFANIMPKMTDSKDTRKNMGSVKIELLCY